MSLRRILICLSRIDRDRSTSYRTQEAIATAATDGLVNSNDAIQYVLERFMEQRLDHFDRQQSKTFNQRYFINKRCSRVVTVIGYLHGERATVVF